MTETDFQQFLLNQNDFDEVQELGNGRFGEINLIKRKTPIGQTNLFVKRKIDNTDESVKRPDYKKFLKEIVFFITVRPHPCIQHFFGFFINPNAIIVEYAKNGSLQRIWDLCKKKKAPAEWTNTARAKALFGIAAALLHLHSYGATHRYLSLTNVLLDDKFEIRLSDFGFAKMEYDATRMSEIANNPIYTAPEALQSTEYDKSVDVYAFSIVAYQLLTGKEPYNPKLSSFVLTNNIIKGMRPEIPDDMDPAIAEVLQACWNQVKENRPKFIDILRFLNTYPKPLLPDVDLEEYKSYTETILLSTNIESEDYFYSPKITEDKKQKFSECLSRAEETDDAEDLYHVGRLYNIGYGTVVDSEQAFEYFSRAAEKEHAISMYYVSLFLKEGRGTDIDLKKSTEMIKQSSDLGFQLASLEYAKRLRDGIGIDHQEPKRALNIFKQLAQPPNEMKEAMFEYGNLLVFPPEVPEGSDQYIKQDPKEGIKYLLESINRGYTPAQMVYAKILLNGIGVPQDIKEGISIYQRAAAQNEPVALNNIGNCYETGKYGFTTDFKIAAQYYEKAANLGFKDSMTRYGIFLNSGKGVDKNVLLAGYYFKKAAERGDRLGCHNYASYLQNGIGNIKVNLPEAIKYYEKAGYDASLYKIGDIYYQGIGGVPRDIDKAVKYFKKAAQKGNKNAAQKLKEIEEE